MILKYIKTKNIQLIFSSYKFEFVDSYILVYYDLLKCLQVILKVSYNNNILEMRNKCIFDSLNEFGRFETNNLDGHDSTIQFQITNEVSRIFFRKNTVI